MKKPIPQMDPLTRVSQDYVNVYAWMFVAVELGENRLLERLKNNKVKRYEERYDSEVYDIDFSNPRIVLLNQIADYINLRREQDRLDAKEIIELAKCACDLIYE